jgi:RNA polymerase sigma factor FliA
VVDGDPAVLDAIQASLADTAIEIVVLSDGSAAIAHLAHARADVAIIDERVAHATGLTTCRTLRETAPWMPVIIASSNITEELRWAALRAGASRILRKPIRAASVIAAIADSKRASEQARALLVDCHVDLASSIAGRMVRRYRSLLHPDDISALAHLGLCEAAARFNPFRNEPFIAFACRRIQGAIIDAVRGATAQTRGTRARARAIAQARRALESAHADASPEALAAHLGMPVGDVIAAEVPNRVVFQPLEAEPAMSEGLPAELVEHAEALDRARTARRSLDGIEAAVIEAHYEQGLSLAEVARAHRLSIRKVTQIHNRALALLRRAFHTRVRLA